MFCSVWLGGAKKFRFKILPDARYCAIIGGCQDQHNRIRLTGVIASEIRLLKTSDRISKKRPLLPGGPFWVEAPFSFATPGKNPWRRPCGSPSPTRLPSPVPVSHRPDQHIATSAACSSRTANRAATGHTHILNDIMAERGQDPVHYEQQQACNTKSRLPSLPVPHHTGPISVI